ncbi:MAG TPA: phenylalanine--tRNA ligase subunit alpha [Victivallales bacterium]|nr:phenylalanine--tRNA ligase subunit alpha [Victivallales bacterium]
MSIETINKDLTSIINDVRQRLNSDSGKKNIEAIKISVLGRKGTLTLLTRQLGTIDKVDRPAAGKLINDIKNQVIKLLEDALVTAENNTDKEDDSLDVSLPGRRWNYGKKHPITQTIDDCVAIFRRIGFIVADGPNIETTYHCFDALNTPEDHPSKDETDTFYFADGRLLRTQTSTVQIRVMENQEPPVRIIAPGPCFRRDTPDASHSANFHQLEGLYIDKNVSMADLKSTLLYFAKELLGNSVKIRFRPHFFPFTEPSIEYDFSCTTCNGKGCRLCKYSGWLEISGAGMVDPNVLRNVGYDPEIWNGFAWGMGIERIAMIRHGINDIRYFYDNDLRFLNQF